MRKFKRVECAAFAAWQLCWPVQHALLHARRHRGLNMLCMHAVADLERELKAAGDRTLVVLDCYKTSCGACRYIQSGFVKLWPRERGGACACQVPQAQHL